MAAYYGEAAEVAREIAAQTKYSAVGGVMVGSLGEAPEQALPAIRVTVGQLCDRAATLAERLELVGIRVFGPQHDAACEGVGRPTRTGEIGCILDALDDLSGQIARAHDALTRLESL